MDTNLAQAIDLAEQKAKYDAIVKEVLADKQVLARILKYTLEEFAGYEIPDIIAGMDSPQISQIRLEPGHTNTAKIKQTANEDSVPGEGKIFYDIRFDVYCGKSQIKILINIEAQKSTNPVKLGYHIDNRIIYYLGRMISAQKEVEFVKSNYDDLKAVRSIWICMDARDDEDSIERLRIRQEAIYGARMELTNLDKVQGIIIRLRANENAAKSKHELIAMLEELLKRESADKKKQILSEEYKMIMNDDTERRLHNMCNLSDVILERGMNQGHEAGLAEGHEAGLAEGREAGLAEGREAGLAEGHREGLEAGQAKSVDNIMQKLHMSIEEACEAVGITLEQYQKAKQYCDK